MPMCGKSKKCFWQLYPLFDIHGMITLQILGFVGL